MGQAILSSGTGGTSVQKEMVHGWLPNVSRGSATDLLGLLKIDNTPAQHPCSSYRDWLAEDHSLLFAQGSLV